jgi:hypothetical protein
MRIRVEGSYDELARHQEAEWMVAESGNPDVLRKPTELVAVLSATNLEMLPRPRLVGVRMIEMEPHHHAPPAISVHHLAYCGRVIRLAKVQTDVVSPDSNRNIVLTCCDSVLWSVNPASDIDRQRMPQVLRGGRWNESERVARRNLKPPLRFRSLLSLLLGWRRALIFEISDRCREGAPALFVQQPEEPRPNDDQFFECVIERH